MIDCRHDELTFRFPEVHPDAVLGVAFLRALRPSGGARLMARMPRLGRFPVRPVDDFAPRLPAGWAGHGDVMVPIHRSESLWVNFGANYPFAVQVAAGDLDAVTGLPFRSGLVPHTQAHLVIPEQVWLDGRSDEAGSVLPFVAPDPTDPADGTERITIVAYPMTGERYDRVASEYKWRTHSWWTGKRDASPEGRLPFPVDDAGHLPQHVIAEDRHGYGAWEHAHGLRCVVHLVPAREWEAMTGEALPTTAPTASDYAHAGMPWDAHFAEGAAT